MEKLQLYEHHFSIRIPLFGATKLSEPSLPLKFSVCTTPILGMSNFINTFILECDYLGHGLVVVLMQE